MTLRTATPRAAHASRRPSVAVGVVAAVVLVLLPSSSSRSAAAGTTYFLDPAGNGPDRSTCDVGGSESDPWGDMYWALRCLSAGDTLLVHGSYANPYVADVDPLTRAGTAAAPITVKAAPGERPLLRGRLWMGGGSSEWHHWRFDGINVTYEPSIYDQPDITQAEKDDPVLVKLRHGTHWSFVNAEVWGAPATAQLRVENNPNLSRPTEPAHWVVRNNCIHHTRKSQASVNHGHALTDHNIYVDTGVDAGPGLVERNIAFSAPNGKNLKLGDQAANLRVAYNTFYDATENVLVNGDSHSIEIERNLLVRAGENAGGANWYPNLRGHKLEGSGVVARENLGYDAGSVAPGFLYNWYSEEDRKNTGSGPGVLDGGNNRWPEAVSFDSTSSCKGFHPTTAAGMAYGRWSKMDRAAGSSRTATSVDLSQFGFRVPAAVDAVLIARADQYPDALAGAPFAAKVGGPILLTGSSELGADAETEVKRLAPRVAYLLGGTGALSPQVEADLKAAGVEDVIRVKGTSRWSTAVEVGKRVGGTKVFVVEGAHTDPKRGWPDAVSVAFYAASQGVPILLTLSTELPDATRQALIDMGVTEATIIGGEGAVSSGVAAAVADPDGDGVDEITVDRIKGASRYGTSAAVAAAAVADGADPSILWLASGENWPDALAAGPIVAQYGGVFLLSARQDLTFSTETHRWVKDHAAATKLAVLVGGAGALSPLVEDQVASILD